MEAGEQRQEAIKRLKKKQDFRSHLVAYVVINALVILVWALTGAGFFWPAFVLAGWGVGLVLNAWDVYGRRPITEAQIQEEMRRRGGA